MPRRLSAELADDEIRLEHLSEAHVAAFLELVEDAQVRRFTRVPSQADEAFVRGWIARYAAGLEARDRVGFAVLPARGDRAVGFAGFVQLDLEARQGELGYMVDAAARGRGIAARSLRLLARWGFDELGLERLELRIDVENAASERVARRAGFTQEGVLRSAYFKEGRRADTGVWSRLRSDPPDALSSTS